MMDIYIRHGELVDKKFLDGLTAEESQELEQINKWLDEIDAPHFVEVMELLNSIQEKISQD